MTVSARSLVRPTDESHRVTSLELFSDLVFVFALTQVSAFMAADLTAVGALRGLVILMLLWFSWTSYAWLGNQARADEGLVRAAVIAAMAAVFTIALAIPEVYSDRPGGLDAPLVFALAYAFLRLLHAAVYVVAAGGDRALRRTVLVTLIWSGVAMLVLLTGAVLGPPAQTPLWSLALVVDYVGVYVTAARGGGWRLPAPGHFAERHGLIVLIALGESIVAIGVGAGNLPLSAPVLLAALLGLAVSTCLWWTYFDVVALVAERVLARRDGAARTSLARDSFTYLHFPMVAGIVFLALGLKKVLEYVADAERHGLGDPLHGLPAWALYGGVATYLLALVAFRLRNLGTLNRERLVLAVALVALVPVAEHLPALAALGVVAALLCGLVAYEVVRFGSARDAVRHAEHRLAAPDPDDHGA